MANITALSRVAREDAKQWFFARKLALWLTLFLGLVGVFLYKAPDLITGLRKEYLPSIELGLALLALLLQIIGIICLLRGSYLHRLAREGIRRGMLLDSFGITTEPLDLAYLTQKFSKKTEEKAASLKNDYYSSSKACGLPRLRENLQESAFYTGVLFKSAAWCNLWCLVTPSVAVLIISFWLPLFKGIEIFSISRALVTIMVFFCASGGIAECINLFSASSKSLEVDRRLEKADISKEDVIVAAFTDYFVATELAPPISTRLYKKHRDRLAKAWTARFQ
jgi:hypothetical protein